MFHFHFFFRVRKHITTNGFKQVHFKNLDRASHKRTRSASRLFVPCVLASCFCWFLLCQSVGAQRLKTGGASRRFNGRRFAPLQQAALRAASLALSGPIWINWAYLCLSGSIWVCLSLSGPIWAYLALSEPIWPCLGLSGPI